PKKSILNTILDTRGFLSEEEQNQFLNPPPASYWVKNLPKELLVSLKNSRDLVKETMKLNKYIIIHGDYDVDGICATAILYTTIAKELGYDKVQTFIPNRFEHGYGLSEKSIHASLGTIDEEKVEDGVLFITVDSGITSEKETKILKEMGHSVIITDHHQKASSLPEADAIVWYDQVVGATLSWLLARAIGSKREDFFAYLALATVTDIQPVKNFNRTLVSEGLKVLNSNPPVGIRELLNIAGKKNNELTTYDLGWVIGPRLNASGRVIDAGVSLSLLIEDSQEKAKDLAWELNQVNSQRQDKTMEMYELAAGFEGHEIPKIIISHHENYHEGIIGLVASRLVQKYYRPAIVISTGDITAKGSVRSIPGYNVIESLREREDLFISLGGHPMAAGFSIEKDKIPSLEKYVNETMGETLTSDLLVKTLEIDIEIPISSVTLSLLEELNALRPFGLGNPNPVFCSKNLGVVSVSYVGKEQRHLMLKLTDGDNFYKGIMFNALDFNIDLVSGDRIDIVYTLNRNEFNGKISVDLFLKDIKKVE
ncbi:single-stranded-DNA-specific exonuclease RecJ, partial [Patescibacteria group bacterium]